MTAPLDTLFQGGTNARKPRGSRKALMLESLEERTLLSWAATPPASVAVPASFTSVTLNALNDASGSASITSLEIDWYRFVAPSTGSYVLAATTPASSLDTVLGLYSSSGQRLAFNDNFGGSTDSQTTGVLTAGQTYYLGVTNWEGNLTNGSYGWSINGPNDDAYENNDTRATATALGSLPGATRTLAGLQVRDDDWFSFTTSAAGLGTDFVRVDFAHSQGDVNLALYSAAGTLLTSSTGLTDSEQVSLGGRAAGTYFVRVYGYAGARNPSYRLTIEPPDDGFENNDTLATATRLGSLPGSERVLTGLRLADDDWFSFTTSAAGLGTDFVRVDFAHSQGDVNLALYNAAGTLLASSTGVTDSEQVSLGGRAAGTYFARVYGLAGARNPSYRLTIEPPDDRFENNDTLATATRLGSLPGASRSSIGEMRLADDDWFSFTTSAAGLDTDFVRVYGFAHSEGDVDLALYDAAGTLLTSSTGVTDSEQVSLGGRAAGTYFVRVYGYSGAQNPRYQLTIEPPDDGFENNDTRATATSLSWRFLPGSPLVATELRLADDDWFSFTTSAAGLGTDFVRVDFAHSQGDVDLELYSAAGTLLASSTGLTDSEQVSLGGRAAGTYFVRVYGYSGAQNPSYQLTIMRPDRFPDLQGNVTRMVSRALWGQAINVETAIQNLGSASGPFQLQWYLSQDDIGGTDDILLSRTGGLGTSYSHAAMAADTFDDIFSVSLLLPAMPAGWVGTDFYLILKTDSAGQVVETDENNNFGQAGDTYDRDLIFITAPTVDLQGYWTLATDGALWGQAIDVQTAIENGGSASGPFQLQWYLSRDGIGGTGDILLSRTGGLGTSYSHAAMAADTFDDIFSVSLLLPAMPAGWVGTDFYLILKTDSAGQVVETDENNNFGQVGDTYDRDPITITALAFASAKGQGSTAFPVAAVSRSTVMDKPRDLPHPPRILGFRGLADDSRMGLFESSRRRRVSRSSDAVYPGHRNKFVAFYSIAATGYGLR